MHLSLAVRQPVENCTSLIEPPAQKSVHIDFETPITGIGWRATEIYNVTGSYFRWSVSSRCELYTRLQAGHNYSLRLRLVEAISPEVLDSLQMKINDYSIALERVDDDPAFIVLQGRIPSEAIPSDETLRAYPNNPAARKAMRAQAK